MLSRERMTMNIRRRVWGVVWLLLLAGCNDSDEIEQSGTDPEGPPYSCSYRYQEPSGTSVPLDEKWDYQSPAEYYARLEGTYFSGCKGVTRVTIKSGSAARNTFGVLNGGSPDERCPAALQLDATTRIEASDPRFVHDSTFVTWTGSGYAVGGSTKELWFDLKTDAAGNVRSLQWTDGTITSSFECYLWPTPNGEGGSGGESD